MSKQTIILPGDGTDFEHWRSMARWLWSQQVPPQDVVWLTEDQQRYSPDLFVSPSQVTHPADLHRAESEAKTPTLTAPRAWLELAEHSLLNCAPERFGVLYRLLCRMQRDKGLRHDPLDPDHVQMQLWVKSVRREVHKMHAFVRFRPVAMADNPIDGTGPLYVAWFEPVHHIVQAAAPFFVKRFANMRWAILTPQCSLRWWPQAPQVSALAEQGVAAPYAVQPLKGRSGVLSWGPGAQASDAPDPDDGEGLWLTYYAHIFNPARLKIAAMRKEMPRRYWRNLPEAPLISSLIQSAQARSAVMIDSGPSIPQRKLPSKPKPN